MYVLNGLHRPQASVQYSTVLGPQWRLRVFLFSPNKGARKRTGANLASDITQTLPQMSLWTAGPRGAHPGWSTHPITCPQTIHGDWAESGPVLYVLLRVKVSSKQPSISATVVASQV
jgi:hypothetical protein